MRRAAGAKACSGSRGHGMIAPSAARPSARDRAHRRSVERRHGGHERRRPAPRRGRHREVLAARGLPSTRLPRAISACLRTRGYESESDIPFAGLLELLTPLLPLRDRIPEVQARALGSALALEAPTPFDRFAVPAGMLSLLAAAAEERPYLVVADDVHWLDDASREALSFVARRLGAEGVVLVLAARPVDEVLAAFEGIDVARGRAARRRRRRARCCGARRRRSVADERRRRPRRDRARQPARADRDPARAERRPARRPRAAGRAAAGRRPDRGRVRPPARRAARRHARGAARRLRDADRPPRHLTCKALARRGLERARWTPRSRRS